MGVDKDRLNNFGSHEQDMLKRNADPKNKTIAIEQLGRLYGALYWHARGVVWGRLNNPRAYRESYIEIKRKLADKEYPPERNAFGNIKECVNHSSERYAFDFGGPKGWKQYDTTQDAWYFGIWYNPQTLQTLSYAEGDIVLTTCPNWPSFVAEMRSMDSFYGEEIPITAVAGDGIGIDGKLTNPVGFYDSGARLDYTQDQPTRTDPLPFAEVLKIFNGGGDVYDLVGGSA